MPNFSHKLTKYIIGFVLFAFAIVGITGGLSQFGEKGNKIAKVGNVNIWKSDFDRLYSREAENLQRITGRKISNEELSRAGLPENVLRVLEEHALMVNYLNEIGLRVPEEDVYSYIKSNEVFFDENGLFSKQKFESLLSENQFSTEKYFNTLKDSILQSILLSVLFSHTIPVHNIASIFTDFRYRTNVVDLIKIDSSFIDDNKISLLESEINDYYQNNKNSFRSAPKRKADFIMASLSDIKNSISVAENEFEEILEEFVASENEKGARDLVNVIFPSYKLASDAKLRIEKGEDFDLVINSMSDKGVLKNSISEVYRDELPSNVSETLFNMQEVGQVSEVLSTEFGWHILKLQKIHVYSKDDLRPIVREQMITEKAVEAFSKLINSLEEKSRSFNSIDEIGQSLGLKVNTTDWISSFLDENYLDYNNEKNSALPNVFINSVFETDIGKLSGIFTDDDADNYYIVMPREEKEAVLLSFDEVKDRISSFLIKNKRDKELKNIAESIKGQLIDRDGNGISSAAAVKLLGKKNININQQIYSPFALNRAKAEYPEDFVKNVFSLRKKSEVSDIFKNGDDEYLFAILRSSFEAPSIEGYEEKFESTSFELSSSFKSSIHEAMINYLKHRYKIKRYV